MEERYGNQTHGICPLDSFMLYWLWGKTPGGRKILLLGAETFGCHYFERCFILSAMRLYKVSFVKPPSEIIESGIKSITSKNNLLLLSM